VSLSASGLVVSRYVFSIESKHCLQLYSGKEGVGPNFKFADGSTFLRQFVMPNFYFHSTTAYSICRMQGVPLGKLDFMASGCALGQW
jgi:hypothetical protein